MGQEEYIPMHQNFIQDKRLNFQAGINKELS